MSKEEQLVNFGTALDAMMEGCKVARSRWKGKLFIEEGKIFLEIGNVCGTYDMTTEDILATDWEILENENGNGNV